MFQNPIIVICSGGLSGLIFALSLSEVFVAEKISGKILLYHENYKIHRLLELIKKLPKETAQLIHERFDPAQTSQDLRFDLLVLADGYSVDLCDSCQFEKEVISNHYELEIKFNLADIYLQNSETEHEQKISLEITRNILDKFSNGMLNYKKELVHQFQLRSMDNILSQVIYKTINNYNKQYPDDQSSIDSSDFMTTLNKYLRLFKIDVLDQLKKEYVNNVKISAPEIYIKKLDRIQNIVNYLIIYESCLSSHKNIESNKGDWVELSQSSLILQDFDSNKIPD
ncbi:hypothetical protein RhiirC2_797573 [Rhizophagus irregularis]|uniref:Uncharacterized protein n=1 Tax=Rhizophagus irregularis TaxID=588596 RepID=A0A2N1M7U0_9GLOM|nr:hypothetical protein RhiirC2_797573 [Rhizophagus irregularis]